jgi:hypothetical protein
MYTQHAFDFRLARMKSFGSWCQLLGILLFPKTLGLAQEFFLTMWSLVQEKLLVQEVKHTSIEYTVHSHLKQLKGGKARRTS